MYWLFTPTGVHTLYTMIKSSAFGPEPRPVPELGQKTFRLPPPEWGSNRNFLRRLPPIMYKGGIMYATQKRKFFRLRAGTPPGTGTRCVGTTEAPPNVGDTAGNRNICGKYRLHVNRLPDTGGDIRRQVGVR